MGTPIAVGASRAERNPSDVKVAEYIRMRGRR
jgi:hypothetical protein